MVDASSICGFNSTKTTELFMFQKPQKNVEVGTGLDSMHIFYRLWVQSESTLVLMYMCCIGPMPS